MHGGRRQSLAVLKNPTELLQPFRTNHKVSVNHQNTIQSTTYNSEEKNDVDRQQNVTQCASYRPLGRVGACRPKYYTCYGFDRSGKVVLHPEADRPQRQCWPSIESVYVTSRTDQACIWLTWIGTEKCQVIQTSIGNTDFAIMDTPGFDDTTRSDAEILKVITEQLSVIRLLGYNLKGIVYLHRITDNRMGGSAMRSLDIFKKLVGEDALSNVVLATTMWGNVLNIEEANRRDSELREEYWGGMRRQGSTATRFDGTQESAQGIVSQLLGKRSVVLKVQEELVDREMSLNQTAAGAFLEPEVYAEAEQYQRRLEELESELKFERDGNKRLEVKRSQRRNAKELSQRVEDKETMKSKPGVEVKGRLKKWKETGGKVGLQALQGLAAVVSISFGIAGFFLGASF